MIICAIPQYTTHISWRQWLNMIWTANFNSVVMKWWWKLPCQLCINKAGAWALNRNWNLALSGRCGAGYCYCWYCLQLLLLSALLLSFHNRGQARRMTARQFLQHQHLTTLKIKFCGELLLFAFFKMLWSIHTERNCTWKNYTSFPLAQINSHYLQIVNHNLQVLHCCCVCHFWHITLPPKKKSYIICMDFKSHLCTKFHMSSAINLFTGAANWKLNRDSVSLTHC
jgi:hypothetical protein